MEIVIERSRLNKKIRHINVEDIINILNSFAPVILPPKTESITQLGRTGELCIKSTIRDFESEKPGTHSGDLIIWKSNYPNIRIMIEVKNYTNPIPREQYEKFESEVETGLYTGGIFICNQPISGYIENFGNNKIAVFSYDAEVINMACRMLWDKLYERSWLKVIKHDDINKQCTLLANNIDILKRAQHDIEQLQKHTLLITNKAIQNINKVNHVTNKSINSITMDVQPSETYQIGGYVTIPVYTDCAVLKVAREKLENFLSLYAENDVIISQNKNGCEFLFDNKKIILKFLKTRIDIMFKPNTTNFVGYEINYVDGYVVIHMTEKNYCSDNIYDTIRKLF